MSYYRDIRDNTVMQDAKILIWLNTMGLTLRALFFVFILLTLNLLLKIILYSQLNESYQSSKQFHHVL